VVVEHESAWTSFTRHLATNVRYELPGDRVPPEYAGLSCRFEDTDSGRIGTAHFERSLHQFLQDRLRRVGQRLGQRRKRPIFRFVIRCSSWAARQFSRYENVIE